MILKSLGIVILFYFSNLICVASSADSTLSKNSFYILPTVSYQQETTLALGLAAAYYLKSDDLSRISSVSGTAVYTFQNQFIFNLSPKIYLNNNRWYLYSNFSVKNYPDYYYGMGIIQNSKRVAFTTKNSSLLLQPQYIISKSFFIGALLSYESEHLVSDLATNNLNQGLYYRAADWNPYHQFNIGLVIAHDSRDNQFYPNKGNFAKTTLSLSKAGWGSSYSLQEISLDIRNYIPLSKRHILATQLYCDGIYGPAPFGQLPTTGGSDLLRGFRQGQYRDKIMITAQSEYRAPIYKNLKGAAFYAFGNTINDSDFKVDKLKMAYGCGLRYQLNDAKVHLRFDIAKNNYGDKLQFYVTATEAF